MDQEQGTRSRAPGAGHQEQCVAPQALYAAQRRLCFKKKNNLSKGNLSKPNNLSKKTTCQKPSNLSGNRKIGFAHFRLRSA